MRRRRLTEAALAGLGIALILAALAADQGWWDRHFMPIFAIQRSTLIAAERVVRGLIALAGAALSLVLRRPIAAALSGATIGGSLRILLSVVLALGAGGLILRGPPPPPPAAQPPRPSPATPAPPV